MDLTAVSIIEGILAAEREAGPIKNEGNYIGAKVRRSALAEMVGKLERSVKVLTDQVAALHLLPDEGVVAWAKNALAMANIVFMEVDTTGVNEYDRVTRFVLVDAQGDIIKDLLINPQEPIGYYAGHHSGLSDEMLAGAPTVADVWGDIIGSLQGKYVVSFNQEFDLKMLNNEAERHSFAPISVIGACLLQQARIYYHKNESKYNDGLSLDNLATCVGLPMPEKPRQSACNRVSAQIDIIRAMSQGITDVNAAQKFFYEDPLGDLDDHPF